MKKWIIIGIAVLLVAAVVGVLIWQPWQPELDVPIRGHEDTTPDDGPSFYAEILEMQDDYVLVKPLEDEQERNSSDKISFSKSKLKDINVAVGSVVLIHYDGMIQETYPATIRPSKWSQTDKRVPYTGQWLDKETAEKYDGDFFSDIIISAIYSDCFFAYPAIPMPYEIKLNGQLSQDWCIGDQIITTHENVYYDQENQRVEADVLTVEASDWEPDPIACYKPVIYLYPEQETEVSVQLALQGKLTCVYPAYEGMWQVTAAPDGTLTDKKGQIYNYLYWEGLADMEYDLSEGFCVKGEDTAAFLEQALEQLGLSRREANEFIVYWLPLMEANPYNIISFQQENYREAAALEVTPAPDTVIRVFMVWQAAEAPVTIAPQALTAPERTGFTVIEWGGTEIK